MPIGANLSDFMFFHRPHALLWTALTVKTGEIIRILFRPEKLAQDPNLVTLVSCAVRRDIVLY